MSIGGIQAQRYAPFIELLNSDLTTRQLEVRIDSFFLTATPQLTPLQLAECYHDRGGGFHYKNFQDSGSEEELNKAIYYTRLALDMKEKLQDEGPCAANRSLYNLGLFHGAKGLFDQALYYFHILIREGEDRCGDTRADYLVDIAKRETARNLLEIGEYYEARKLLAEMINAYESDSTISDSRPYWAYRRMAQTYMAVDPISYSAQAKFYLKRARDYIDKNGFDCCWLQNRIDQLEGNLLAETEAYKAAIIAHKRVVSNLPEWDSINLARAHNSLAINYFENGDIPQAQEHLKIALDLDPYYDSPHNNLGDIYLSEGKFEAALQSYQRAVDRSVGSLSDSPYSELPGMEAVRVAPYKAEVLNHLVFKTRGWIAWYEATGEAEKLEHALETIDLADQLVDVIREASYEQQTSLFWRKEGSELYELAVRLAYLLEDPERAFYYMERNKAILLLEDLSHRDAKKIGGIPEDLSQRETEMQAAIQRAEVLSFETQHAGGSADSLRSEIRGMKMTHGALLDSLEAEFPEYARYKSNLPILPLATLKADYLGANQAVLQFLLTPEEGYAIYTDSDATQFYELQEVEQMNSNVQRLIRGLGGIEMRVDEISALSNRVYRMLFPEEIREELDGKQLLVVPDYTLQNLPFEALVTDPVKGTWLLETTDVTYAYSLSHQQTIARSETVTGLSLLALAPVDFQSLELPSLPNSLDEATQLAGRMDGLLLSEEAAQRQAFQQYAPEYAVLHLSTHADLGDGENPWIAFRDSKMSLKELYATRTRASMVVLSACNTSNGNLRRGEGVMSLARGFFYSGAKSVVSSLWPAEDKASTAIMLSFYKGLEKGLTKSEAMRQAKLEYLAQTETPELRHPFYWAGFVVLGDNSPLRDYRPWWWLGAGAFIAIAGVFYFRRRSVKRIQ